MLIGERWEGLALLKIELGDVFYTKGLKHQGDSKPRPVIVVSPTQRNQLYSTVIVVPITSYPLDALFRPLVKGTGIQTQSRAECDRITCISKQLLDNKIGTLEPASLAAVKQGIAFALEFGLD